MGEPPLILYKYFSRGRAEFLSERLVRFTQPAAFNDPFDSSAMLKKLSAYPRQNGLAKALREIGRIERTLFTLDWIKNPDLRRRAHLGLNKGEARNALARAVYFCRLGEVRDRSFENQFIRASGLNLLVAAIILWNTKYLEVAYAEQRRQGGTINEDLLRHVAPLGWEHIGLTGDYVWSTAVNRRPVRSDHCGNGNPYWWPEFWQCSRCRTVRALSCSDPYSTNAAARHRSAFRFACDLAM